MVKTAGGTGLIPGQGTKILHVVLCGKKQKQNKTTKTSFRRVSDHNERGNL